MTYILVGNKLPMTTQTKHIINPSSYRDYKNSPGQVVVRTPTYIPIMYKDENGNNYIVRESLPDF